MRQHRVTPDEYIVQIASALRKYGPHEMISLYNDGSFFSEHELPKGARDSILSLMSKNGAEILMVESLPEFITPNNIESAVSLLKGVKLTVAIGLQTTDDRVRRNCIASPVWWNDFLHAVRVLQLHGCNTKAYLLFRPPFLTERESVADCVRSIVRLSALGVDDISICPIRIVQGTLAAELHRLGFCAPPALSSVGRVLNLTRKIFPARVSLVNVASADMVSTLPVTCGNCSQSIMKAFYALNENPTFNDFDNLECSHCSHHVEEADALSHVWTLPLEERIHSYLTMGDCQPESRSLR